MSVWFHQAMLISRALETNGTSRVFMYLSIPVHSLLLNAPAAENLGRHQIAGLITGIGHLRS